MLIPYVYVLNLFNARYNTFYKVMQSRKLSQYYFHDRYYSEYSILNIQFKYYSFSDFYS